MTKANPYADVMKAFSNVNVPNFDYNSVFSAQRRNIEAVTEANQLMAESLQAISRRQAEIARSSVDQVLKASKDMVAKGSPELNTGKQADLAKSLFENSLNNMREVTEMLTKSVFEASDVINRRAAESMEEISNVA